MFLYITEKTVSGFLNEKTSFRLAREAFSLAGRKKTQMPPKIYLQIPDTYSSDFRSMPAFIDEKNNSSCGVKWISVFPGNRRLGLPTVNGTILLNSPDTGAMLAIIEANTITAMRTAAAAAVASHYLAIPKPKKLAIVGAGLQAEYQLRAHFSRYKFDEISVWGYKEGEAANFCRRFRQMGNPVVSSDIKKCVSEADIVVTCTPSKKPLVKRSWIKKGAHINAIGADAKGKRELDPALLAASKVVVDEWEQACHSGEINVPCSKGLFSKRTLYAELGEIVCEKKKGRGSRDEITIFDSTGLAVLDIYFAKYVYDAYQKAPR